MTASFTDTVTCAGITARRTWSGDPATDPYAYVVDQRCIRCNTQVTDDDRGPFYDSATDDGTAHICTATAGTPNVRSQITPRGEAVALIALLLITGWVLWSGFLL